MRRNRRARRGFSLTEMLVAVAILALVAAALAAGIPAAMRAYRQATVTAEAGVLGSTLTTAISDELHFAAAPAADGSYNSAAYGPGARLVTEDGRVKIAAGGTSYDLLGGRTYTSGMTAAAVADYSGGVYQVTLTIADAAGRQLSQAAFTVVPLND